MRGIVVLILVFTSFVLAQQSISMSHPIFGDWLGTFSRGKTIGMEFRRDFTYTASYRNPSFHHDSTLYFEGTFRVENNVVYLIDPPPMNGKFCVLGKIKDSWILCLHSPNSTDSKDPGSCMLRAKKNIRAEE